MFLQAIHGSSRPEVFCNKYVLENVTKFTGKHLCQSLFLNKFAGVRPPTLLKKKLWHRCFPVNFAKFLRTPFLTEYLWATASELFTTYFGIDTKLTDNRRSLQIGHCVTSYWLYIKNSLLFLSYCYSVLKSLPLFLACPCILSKIVLSFPRSFKIFVIKKLTMNQQFSQTLWFCASL